MIRGHSRPLSFFDYETLGFWDFGIFFSSSHFLIVSQCPRRAKSWPRHLIVPSSHRPAVRCPAVRCPLPPPLLPCRTKKNDRGKLGRYKCFSKKKRRALDSNQFCHILTPFYICFILRIMQFTMGYCDKLSTFHLLNRLILSY